MGLPSFLVGSPEPSELAVATSLGGTRQVAQQRGGALAVNTGRRRGTKRTGSWAITGSSAASPCGTDVACAMLVWAVLRKTQTGHASACMLKAEIELASSAPGAWCARCPCAYKCMAGAMPTRARYAHTTAHASCPGARCRNMALRHPGTSWQPSQFPPPRPCLCSPQRGCLSAEGRLGQAHCALRRWPTLGKPRRALLPHPEPTAASARRGLRRLCRRRPPWRRRCRRLGRWPCRCP